MRNAACVLLGALLWAAPVVHSQSGSPGEKPSAIDPEASEHPAIEKIIVPVGADQKDPVLRAARGRASAARQQWALDLREHLLAQPDLRPSEMERAEAAFIRANFDRYVAVLEGELSYQEQLADWHKMHEMRPTGAELIEEQTGVDSETLNPREKRELEAYRRASRQLLELEDRAEMPAVPAVRSEVVQPKK